MVPDKVNPPLSSLENVNVPGEVDLETVSVFTLVRV